jgi:hypothetical protein
MFRGPVSSRPQPSRTRGPRPLGHTRRLERKSIPRRVERDQTDQRRTLLLREREDLVLITSPALERLAFAVLGHGPAERAVRLKDQPDGHLRVWFCRPLALQVLRDGRRRGHILRGARFALRRCLGVSADSGLERLEGLESGGLNGFYHLVWGTAAKATTTPTPRSVRRWGWTGSSLSSPERKSTSSKT